MVILVLVIIALLCFIGSLFPPAPQVNLVSVGGILLSIAMLVGRI